MSKFSDALQAQLQEIQGHKMQDTESCSAIILESSGQNEMVVSSAHTNRLETELGLRDKTALEFFLEHPCARTFRNILKGNQTPEIVSFAVERDGLSLEYVSKKLITNDLCKLAVSKNGLAIKYIPEEMLSDEIIQTAVENNGRAISFLKGYITKQLSQLAVRQSMKLAVYYDYPIAYVPTKIIDKALILDSINYSPCSLKNIPRKYISKDIVFQAVKKDSDAFAFVHPDYMSSELIELAVNNNPNNLSFVPLSKRSEDICVTAFQKNPFTIRWIPEQYISAEMCVTAINHAAETNTIGTGILELLPNTFRNNKTIMGALVQLLSPEAILQWNQGVLEDIESQSSAIKPLSQKIVSYLKKLVLENETKPIGRLIVTNAMTPPAPSDASLIPLQDEHAVSYDLSINDGMPSIPVYYISDLHIEHQLQAVLENENCSNKELSAALDLKIKEMISSIQAPTGYLLIAGDVGHYKGIVSLFYERIKNVWEGTIISIIGNHELWDDHPDVALEGYISRPVDEIIADYREVIHNVYSSSMFLQNALFVNYKNRKRCVIEEEQLLSATDEDLRDICSKSSLIVLGGLGFSGCCEHFNANNGIYRSAVMNLETDQKLSKQFEMIHDKLLRCASDIQVIVLTHTPVSNWTLEEPNPNWVYINGHTHQNSLIRKRDGTTVLSDNQVGYKPIKWKLNSFKVAGWYDPFKDLDNGIHEISSEDYMDFNCGRGIASNGCNYPGKIYVLKKYDAYMFVLQSTSSLCLLDGGNRKRLDRRDIQYYYDRMEKYVHKVIEAITPYQNALSKISDEVCKFGGKGTIHGCIVDIDYWNHIYLNPFDGTITLYYATDLYSRMVYDDLSALLKSHAPELCEQFKKTQKQGMLPLLTQYGVKIKKGHKKKAVATIPSLVVGTEIYQPSRAMKSFQYIYESNVIRIWNEEILTTDFVETTRSIDMKANLESDNH